MKRLVLHIPRRKDVDGPRVLSKAFGAGTIIKDGPEQSLVVWDDTKYDSYAETYMPNTHFRRLT